VSRKLAKENLIILAILLSALVFPGPAPADQTIQTTQLIVAIDPGHGGAKKGLIASDGTPEKTIVLSLAKKTAQKLETRYNVMLTRTSDLDLPARERVFFANKNRADLFISLHLHHSDPLAAFFFYFDPPESDRSLTPSGITTWKSQSIVHQPAAKRAVTAFSHFFSGRGKTIRPVTNGMPIIFLEGTTMPAILFEPLAVSSLPRSPEQLEAVLDETAGLIAQSIDLFFTKE
jgi:N-acetylmuramoyl-L-alanine amidase